MIEVMFGDSEAAAMKIALKSGKGFGNDVVCLGFMLDIGNIRKPVDGEYRSEMLRKLLYREQWGVDDKMQTELSALGKKYSHELCRLRSCLANGEQIRIWYSSSPYSMCGLLWLCGELHEYDNRVYAVKLPAMTTKKNQAVSYSTWGEVEPNRIKYFLSRERLLSPLEINTYARYWNGLQNENAPLRAVLNGTVISVPASFYDFLILKYLEKKPLKEAVLIGKIMCENRIGVGDYWYAYRIDKMISQNRIIITENSSRKYERTISINNT